MNWLEKSKNLLREACTPWGIKASLITRENYGAIFTRDAVMAGIAGILLEDEVVINGLKNTLINLKKLQGHQGQIPSNFIVEHKEIVKVSYGTLSPKIDACTWYLIGVGLMIKEDHIEKEIYQQSVEKTINLLEGIEFNGKNLMYIPKGGNWADEYIYEGYILYDQVLRCWGLALLGSVYGRPKWYEKAKAINETIMQSYQGEDSKYYHSSFYPGGVFSKFDLAAHSIAGIVFKKNNDFFNRSLDWISNTFLGKKKLPPAFYPEINVTDPEWDALRNYFLFRFKNSPHHFHNGGIWWIWLGWLSITFSLWDKEKPLEQLIKITFKYLEENKLQFDFDEYISADTLQPGGTKRLVYTASGITFLSLAKNAYDFSKLKPFESPTIYEPLVLKKEYFELSKQLVALLKKSALLHKQKLVIGIAGESGSGKSVTAKCLQIELEKRNISSLIIHQDGYYKLPPKENHEKRKADINWVGTNELHLNLMQEHIDKFKNEEALIEIPIVHYKNNKFTSNKTILKDKTVLIVEGVYTFFLNNLDYKVFMSRTYKDTLNKRKSRVREKYDPFVEQVLKIEHSLVSKQKNLANVTINKEYHIDKFSEKK